jgi:hypothetical protein
MIKKTVELSIILIFVLAASSLFSAAVDIPTPPHRFKGYVIDETGELAIDGTIVSANLNNIYYNTTVKNGTYGFTTVTQPFYVNGSSGDAGKTILFYIDGTLISQTAVYVTGGLNSNFEPYFNVSLDTTSVIISSVTISSLTESQATISWTTDKFANSTVNYGITTSLGSVKHDAQFLKNHAIVLSSLQPETTYYFEVISYDYSGHKAKDNSTGQFYHFTTAQQQQGGPGGDGGVGESPSEINVPPLAHANGPYYGLVNESIVFDASKSNDTDGYIVNYTWNLGDGTTVTTTQVRTNHAYSRVGNYTITLTVTDNKGATNVNRSKAYISTNDSDGDGWSDAAERYYGTDSRNALSYPKDSDSDGIPDSVDPDDDNDGLTDVEELRLGTDPTNNADVLRILNDYGLFFLLDTNADKVFDSHYNQSNGVVTTLFSSGNGTFLIDVNGDGKYEYSYTPATSAIIPYQKSLGAGSYDYILVLLVIIFIAIIIVIISVVYKVRRKKNKS